MRIVITGTDDVFLAAAVVEGLARDHGIAVIRDDLPIPAIDYSLEDLLGLRRSDLELAVTAADPTWATVIAGVRARFPGLTLTIE